MKSVVFRVDGNQIIATGHVMRCLSIARKIKEYSTKAIFITADDNVCELIKSNGFENIILGTSWDNMESELTCFIEVLDKIKADYDVSAVVVDSYAVTENYLVELKKLIKKSSIATKLFYIDDLNSMVYPVDALINYNIYGDLIDYDKSSYNELYLGTKYVPLRDEFVGKTPREYGGVKKMLLSSGGADEYDVIGSLLAKFVKQNDFGKFEYYCVLGRFNKNIDALKENYASYDNIHLLQNVSNMSEYMMMCDVAVTAGGSTCYELCACGIPAVSYTFADNQLSGAKTFSDKGIISYAGDVRDNVDYCIDNIISEIANLKDKSTWEARSQRMQAVVDGNGAGRLAKVMLGECH